MSDVSFYYLNTIYGMQKFPVPSHLDLDDTGMVCWMHLLYSVKEWDKLLKIRRRHGRLSRRGINSISRTTFSAMFWRELMVWRLPITFWKLAECRITGNDFQTRTSGPDHQPDTVLLRILCQAGLDRRRGILYGF